MSDEPEDVTVAIADDERAVRESLSMMVDAQPGLTVVGQGSNGEEAVRLCEELRPDVLLLDVNMPHRDGLWALAELSRRGLLGEGGTEVVLLTTFGMEDRLEAGLAWGAWGFLLKNASYEQLVATVRVAAARGGQRGP